MKRTVGSADKIVRIIIAVVLVVVALKTDIGFGLKIAALVVAGIAIVTGFTGLCPLYSALGISTLGKKK